MVIRVNVDRTNISRVHEILDILEEEGLRNKLGFYIAAVDDSASQSLIHNVLAIKNSQRKSSISILKHLNEDLI